MAEPCRLEEGALHRQARTPCPLLECLGFVEFPGEQGVEEQVYIAAQAFVRVEGHPRLRLALALSHQVAEDVGGRTTRSPTRNDIRLPDLAGRGVHVVPRLVDVVGV